MSMDAQYQTTVTQAVVGEHADLTITADRRLRVDGGAGTAGTPSGGVQSVQETGTLLDRIGAIADAAWTSGSGSVIALSKAIAGAAISTAAVLIYRSDSYSPISTKTTTQVKSGAGTLCKVIINAAGTADTITIYDALSATGTPIATIGAALIGTTFAYDCTVATGICVVTGGTTAGNYTVTYK